MKRNILNLKNVRVLGKKELETIGGGQMMTCSCHGHPGTWTGDYSSIGQIVSDVNKYCANGGSCSQATLAQ